MLRSLGLAILLLTTQAGFADDVASITTAPARTRVLSNRDDLAKLCSTANRIFGCTAFAGEMLTFTCERRETAWRARAQAQFIPYIYLLSTNVEGIGHERLHIADIERSLRLYLSDLESRTFESESSCQTSSELEASLFSRRMDEWKTQSNLDRHPELRRAAK